MGRQSARLYYQGMDHKDIYFQHKFHIKMYKGNKLLWEKLYPDECLLAMGPYGIHIFDIENKCFDFMPVYNSQASMNDLCCVGNALIVNFFSSEFDINSRFKLAYSTDAETFKEITEIEPISQGSVLTNGELAYTDNSCAFVVPADDNWYTIATYESEKLKFSKVVPYASSEYIGDFIPGKGEYITVYGYVRSSNDYVIYRVDSKANIVSRFLCTNSRRAAIQVQYWCCVKSSIYLFGRRTADNMYVIGKINANIIEWDENNLFATLDLIGTISVSEEEVVVYADDIVNKKVVIFSFKENGYIIANTLVNGLVQVKLTNGGTVNVFAGSVNYGGDATVNILPINRHTIYMKDKKPICTWHQHGLFYCTASNNLPNTRAAYVYFDNPYFLESDGNLCDVITYEH